MDVQALPDMYEKRRRWEFPLQQSGTVCGRRVFASFPLAKVSEIEEEQEDPYLNDRCRGETGPASSWLGTLVGGGGPCLLTGGVTLGLRCALWLGVSCKSLSSPLLRPFLPVPPAGAR